MGQNDYAGVEQLITTHASFRSQEWLHGLGTEIRQYCVEHRALAQVQPITSAPTLYTINGIGTMLYGQQDEDARTGSHVATLYFTFLCIPVFPIACYRVIKKGNGAWSFLGKVPYSDREIRRWIIFAIAVIALIAWNGSGGGTSTSNVSAAGISSPTSSNSADSATDGAQSAYAPQTSAPDWYASGKSHVDELASTSQALDADLSRSEASVNEMRSQIDAAESGSGIDGIGSEYYRDLIDRHDAAADEHNATLSRRRMAYTSYEDALNAFNQHVDAHNTSHNP
jgi:hypothetical protein